MNSIKEKLDNGKQVVGTWCNSGSPIAAELLAAAGFDYICVDVEHSAVDLPETQRIFQAIASGNSNCSAVVRVHGVDYSLVKRYVDAGAKGVICPLITNKEEAEQLVQAVKYPPLGSRGVGFCRANRYGLDVESHFASANDDILTVVQIEHIDAVNQIDKILTVPGIDAVFIGPYDLSASMGLAAQFNHPTYLTARDKILDSCRNHSVVCGIHVVEPDPEQLKARVGEGYRLLAYSLDITMLLKSAQEGVAKFRSLDTV